MSAFAEEESLRRERRGLFVVFEGLDGAGTTTQALRVGDRLTQIGVSHALTNEPSSGPLGAVVRSAIRGQVPMSAELLALAFAADRLHHIEEPTHGIEAMLAAGVTVICDRYVLSSLAYQASQGVDLDWLVSLNSRAPQPDVTIFIDTDVDECVARIASRELYRDDIFHKADSLRKIRRLYRSTLNYGQFLGQLITANGNQSIEAVFNQVWSQLEPLVRAKALV